MKVKIDKRLYATPDEADRLTLGEQALLKREYGFVPARDGVDLRDPDHIRAFLFMSLRKALPDAPAQMLVDQVDQVKEVDFVNDDGSPLSEEEQQEERDPTPPPSVVAPAPAPAPAEASS